MHGKTMKEALNEVRSFRDVATEGGPGSGPQKGGKKYSSANIKKAYGILNDPRYKQGNYTGAAKAINKLAPGLADHPDVKNAMKRANEELEENTIQDKSSVLETLENELGSTDEYFELNQVGVKTVESYEIGTDEYRKHTQMMTPGQPIISFKLANKVIERKDIELFANEDKIIDKYKKRYGTRWKDELDKAVSRMKKEL